MTAQTYVPTIELTGHYSAAETLTDALAGWTARGWVIEATDEPRDVLVKSYVDNGYDPHGWYVSEAKRVNIRIKGSKKSRTWDTSTLIFAQSREKRMLA
jgi:hypothetical protein